MNLLDADVCVDLLREYPPAIAWFETTEEDFNIPGIVAIELIVGARSKADLQRVKDFLTDFAIVWPQNDDMERALQEYAPLALPHGLQGMDILIAATVTGLNATLHTFNIKHFRAVPGLSIEQPYTR